MAETNVSIEAVVSGYQRRITDLTHQVVMLEAHNEKLRLELEEAHMTHLELLSSPPDSDPE